MSLFASGEQCELEKYDPAVNLQKTTLLSDKLSQSFVLKIIFSLKDSKFILCSSKFTAGLFPNP